MAGALVELKKHIFNKDYPELDINLMQIYIVEAGNRLLSSMSQVSSDKTLFFLKKMGVNVLLNTRLIGYDGEEILLENTASIFSKNLVWTAGVKGNVPDGIAKESIARSFRIQVNEYNQLTNFKNAFAIGDIAMYSSKEYPNGYPMVAPVAIQQGEQLAQNLIRAITNKNLVPFQYRDKGSMATISKNKAVVELHRFKFQGLFAWFVWTFVHLMSIVGFRNRVIVLIDWIWNYFSYDRALRIITGFNDKKKNSSGE